MKYIISENVIDTAIYDYLTDNFYPDYNWGPELHDFYKNEVETYGSYQFEINDRYEYAYYGDGKELVVYGNTYNKLTNLFGNLWKPVFVKWFEDNSGLKVETFRTIKTVTEGKNMGNTEPIEIGIIQWLNHFYGKDPEFVKPDLAINCDPFTFYDPDNDDFIASFKFMFDVGHQSLMVHGDVYQDLILYFQTDNNVIEPAIKKWFGKKFNVNVDWVGIWR